MINAGTSATLEYQPEGPDGRFRQQMLAWVLRVTVILESGQYLDATPKSSILQFSNQ
jgi:hypothetical protein